MKGASIHDRGFTWDEIARLPLMAMHAMLARAEAEIEEALSRYQERTLIPGEGQRAKWAAARTPDDVRQIVAIDQGLREYYARLAELCRKREACEIANLLGRAA